MKSVDDGAALDLDCAAHTADCSSPIR